MQETLKNNLHEYIRQNNPDILLTLEEERRVSKYLNDKVNGISELLNQLENENKPAYIIEEICMDTLTKDLRPSGYNYITNILQEDFEFAYQQMQESGTLLYEVINIMACCKPVFESLGFTEENEDNRQLRYAIIGIINEHLSK